MARILLVEDSKVQAIFAKRILEGAGYTVDHVATAEAALKACYDSPPDIVLQDQHLAEISGLEVCRRIKSDISLSGIPVLALTAGNKDRDHIAALDAGADAFLPKGSPNEELLAIIARQIAAAANAQPVDQRNRANQRSGPTRLLVIDDSETFREVLCRKLIEGGFEVVSASSAQEGLSLLHEKPFDVAVVDVVMPEMDGFEFCTLARKWADESQVQLGLLVMTGSDREHVLVQSLEAGADDYVTKLQEMDVILAHTTALARRIARAKQMESFNRQAMRKSATESAEQAHVELMASRGREFQPAVDSILEMAERLAKTKLADDQRESLNQIQQSAEELRRLVDNLSVKNIRID